MKTVLVTLEYPPQTGGIARYYDQLVRALPAGSIEVLAPTTAQPFLAKRFWPRWLPLLRLLAGRARRDRSLRFLAGQPVPVGTALWLVSLVFGTTYGVFFHGMDASLVKRSAWKRRLVSLILRRSSVALCNSEATRRDVLSFGVPPDRAAVVPPGCSLTEQEGDAARGAKLAAEHGLEGRRILLSVARLVSRKGVATMLHAVARLRRMGMNVAYVVIGDGPERHRLQELAGALDIQQDVLFWGNETNDEVLRAWYSACDLFCLPIRSNPERGDVEGYGIVFLEANAFGKAVVAGRGHGVGEAVIDGTTGLLVDPEDEHAVAEAIRRLLLDDELRSRLGRQGKERVERECRWPARAKAFLAAWRT